MSRSKRADTRLIFEIFKNGTVLNSGDNRFNNQNKIIGNPIVNKGGTAMKIHTPLSLQ